MQSSQYIEQERRAFSLYTIQSRALPAATDGLKPAGRRALWTARNGEKLKTATLAGMCMAIHPHGENSSAINTLTAPYGNNIPFFKGYGAFGTLLNPNAYGAARYTSIAVSQFTKDVMFRDIEIIPMSPNYDDTLEEPVHFLPIVPTALLNPTEGIAVGFATNLLPRSLEDVIKAQLLHLSGKKIKHQLVPTFTPTSNRAVRFDGKGWYFEGDYVQTSHSTLTVTRLPYGVQHEKVIAKLDSLQEAETIKDVLDKSKDVIAIEVTFYKGKLKEYSRDQLLELLGLTSKQNENFNVVDFSGKSVLSTSAEELIASFTDWRKEWYVARYERLKSILERDLQKLYDVRLAIAKNIGGAASKVQSKQELKELLTSLGIVNVDYIADLPVYKFTTEEKQKNEAKIKDGEAQLKIYVDLLSNESKRIDVYSGELKEILAKYRAGAYS